jgi:plastocyanin
MRLRVAAPTILVSSLIVSIVAGACLQTVNSVVQTTTFEQKAANLDATREVLISQGIDPDLVQVAVGKGSIAEQVQQTAAAIFTATAEAGGGTDITADLITLPNGELVTSLRATEIAEESAAIVVPDGPAITGVANVQIFSSGRMDPDVIKITPGTKVIWENTERSNHSSTSDPGQDEVWDSGGMSRRFEPETIKFEHTFTIPGRYSYGSRVVGDISVAYVFVVEE